jgi:hypothetical protein
MTALELLHKLEESGTGREKMALARDVAREMRCPLKHMDAETLVDEMKRRHGKYLTRREVLQDTGGFERRSVEARAAAPAEKPFWGEGTIEKADRILAGMPAVPAATGQMSAVYDIDEEAPAGAIDEENTGVLNPLGAEASGGPHGPAPNPGLEAMKDAEAKDAADAAKGERVPNAPPQPQPQPKRGRPPEKKPPQPGIVKMSQPPQTPPGVHRPHAGDEDESKLPPPPE